MPLACACHARAAATRVPPTLASSCPPRPHGHVRCSTSTSATVRSTTAGGRATSTSTISRPSSAPAPTSTSCSCATAGLPHGPLPRPALAQSTDPLPLVPVPSLPLKPRVSQNLVRGPPHGRSRRTMCHAPRTTLSTSTTPPCCAPTRAAAATPRTRPPACPRPDLSGDSVRGAARYPARRRGGACRLLSLPRL